MPSTLGDWYQIQDSEGLGPRLAFQRVPEAKVVKNRLHLDVTAASAGPTARQSEVDRLTQLAATEVTTITDEVGTFTVMQDPEGNEFCVG